MTPNRKGLSPLPGDLFVTQVVDPNLHVGLTWTRSPQLRFMYHPSETVHLGVSVEASEQFAGGASGSGAITLPKDLASSYGSQLNTGSGNYATPNPHQDVVGKIAFDPKVGNRSLHLEVGGVLTRFAFFNPLTSQHYDAAGGGGSVNVNIEAGQEPACGRQHILQRGCGPIHLRPGAGRDHPGRWQPFAGAFDLHRRRTGVSGHAESGVLRLLRPGVFRSERRR